MIDVIIPAYNSHDTINRAIDSVLTQSYTDYHITIVNDGGKPYNINNVDCLTELSYKENMGPGFARNYGIKHTNGDYILFIDADDYLESTNALQSLISCFKDDVMLVIGGIKAEGPDGGTKLIRGNGNFMHGKMYRRSYLQKYDIWSNENSRCCEDDSFNSQVLLCLDGKTEKDVCISEPVYRWTYTKTSLGRKDPIDWEHRIVPRGMLENKIYVFNQLRKKGIDNKRVRFDKIRTMIKSIVLYVSNRERFPQFDQSNKDVLIRCYYEIYRDIDLSVTDDELTFVYNSLGFQNGTPDDIPLIKHIIEQLRTIFPD